MNRLVRLAGKSALAVIATVPLALPAHAQSDAERIRDLEQKLERSVHLIEQLTARVNRLEGERSGFAAPQAAAPQAAAKTESQAARIEALERDMAQVAQANARSVDTGLPLHGFADVGYDHSTQTSVNSRRSGFVVGNLDFYLTPSFGDRVKTLAELVFEVGPDTGELETDLERLQIGYTVSDALTVWMGRFHTPYGYWNTAYHNGAQLQTTITRPRFIDFADRGGILPTHSVGLWATGHTGIASGHLEYDAYVTNGSRIVDGELDANAFHDDNSRKAAGGRLGYRFGGAFDGLTVGVHALRDDVTVPAGADPSGNERVRMAGAYAVFESDTWQSIAEYYRFRNVEEAAGGAAHTSWAAYWQVDRALDERWIPYLRWEKASLDETDPYFGSLVFAQPYNRGVLGIRYNVNPKAAVKLEAARTRQTATQESFSEARAQFAVRF